MLFFTRHGRPVLQIAVDIEFCDSENYLSAFAVNMLCFEEFQLLTFTLLVQYRHFIPNPLF